MRISFFGIVLAVCFAAPSTGERSLLAEEAAWAVTPAQIEADWDRQDGVREAAREVASGVTVEQDAAGGCDGVKTGKWGFHTQNEAQPWWQVDLERWAQQ